MLSHFGSLEVPSLQPSSFILRPFTLIFIVSHMPTSPSPPYILVQVSPIHAGAHHLFAFCVHLDNGLSYSGFYLDIAIYRPTDSKGYFKINYNILFCVHEQSHQPTRPVAPNYRDVSRSF